MSVLHVNQIKNRLESEYLPFVDDLDLGKLQPEAKHVNKLSRALAAYAVVNNTKLTPEESCKYITDGYGDNGIDLIYYDEDTLTLWLVQSKFVSNGNSGIDNGDMHKFIQGMRDLFDMNYAVFNEKIKTRKDELERAINNPQIKIKAVLAYTGKQLSAENRKIIEGYVAEINDPSELLSFVDFNLEKAHSALVQGLKNNPINTQFIISHWGQIRDPYEAVYGTIPALALAELYKIHGSKLFSDNIRNFLGQSDANKSMERTLRENPDNFVYFNNGITVLCDSFTKAVAGGSKHESGVFECYNVSIINGAQTVGTIGTLFNNEGITASDASVFVKIISMENTPNRFDEEITIANNTQNKIEKKDFVTLDVQQERLKTELLLEGITYHYKRDAQRYPSDDRHFNFEECVQALATRQQDISLSVQAKREIGKLWENISSRPYTDLFNENLDAIYLIHVVKTYRYIIKKLNEKNSQVNDGREKRIYTYGNLFITHIIMKKIDEATLYNKSINYDDFLRNMDQTFEDSINRTVTCANVKYPNGMIPQLFRNFTKCKDMENSLDEML